MLVSTYEKILDKQPKLKFKKEFVYKFTPYYYDDCDVDRAFEEVNNFLKTLPVQDYQLIITSTPTEAAFPKLSNKRKEEIAKLAVRELQKKITLRKLSFYLCFDDKADSVVTSLRSTFKEIEEAKGELFRDLAYLFGGVPEEPLFYPLKKNKTGFKIVGKDRNKIADVLFEHKAPMESIQFGIAHVLINLPTDFLYVLNFYRPLPAEYETEITRIRDRYKDLQAEYAEEIAQQMQSVLNDILLERELLYYYSSCLVIFGDESVYKKCEELKKTIANVSRLSFEQEETGLTVFTANFSFKKSDLRVRKLIRKMTLTNFSYYFPVLKHFTGRKDKIGALYVNPSFEPVYVSPHHPTVHKLTLGGTGSGKSVDITWGALFEDATVFIEYIEKDTGSYKTFIQLVEGEKGYVPISLDRPFSVNPFGKTLDKVSAYGFLKKIGIDYRTFSEPELVELEEVLSQFLKEGERIVTVSRKKLESFFEEFGVSEYLSHKILERNWTEAEVEVEKDKEKQAFVVSVLKAMCAGEENRLPVEYSSFLQQLVATVYDNHDGKREIVVSDFYNQALEMGELGEKVAQRLFPFTSKGAYGSFFDRESDFDRSAENIYFELRTLSKELLNPVLLSILRFVLDLYSHPKMRGKSRRVVIDEGWSVFKNEYLQDFLDAALRTFRKKGIAIDFASQFPSDFTPMLISQTMIRYFKFIDNKKALMENFDLEEDALEEILTLQKPEDLNYIYSPVFIYSPSKRIGKGLARLFLPDFYYWIATTKDEDKIKRDRAVAEHKDLWKAILALAQSSQNRS